MADEEKPGGVKSEGLRVGRPAPAVPESRVDHDPYAAFRFDACRYFAAGNLISVTGRAMLSTSFWLSMGMLFLTGVLWGGSLFA